MMKKDQVAESDLDPQNIKRQKNAILREFHYPQDYSDVIRLWETAGSGVRIGRSDTPEEIIKKLNYAPDLFLIAEIDGRLIGSVIGGFDGRRGIIYHLAVDLEFRMSGVGSSLMEEIERRLVARGCLRSYLLVTPENVDAMSFYEKRGWKRMDIVTFGKDLA
jgi:ribosomal protein S18 acetylase RimI-like enzyme